MEKKERKAWVVIGAAVLLAVPALGLAGEKNDNNPFERLWDAIAGLEERLDLSLGDYVTSEEHEADIASLEEQHVQDVASLKKQIDGLACRLDGGEECAGEGDDGSGGDPNGGGGEEEYLACGTGACARTVPKYADGILQTCEPGEPQIERCDALDNDCDGTSDEGIEGLNESCAGGTGVLACDPSGGGVICKTW